MGMGIGMGMGMGMGVGVGVGVGMGMGMGVGVGQTSFIRGWGVLGFLGTHPPKTKPPTQTPQTLINI